MKAFEMSTISEAVQTLIAAATRPPQIDYVSPGDKIREVNAQRYIDNLCTAQKEEAEQFIAAAIDEYYEDSIEGSDGNMYSVAQLDAMF